MSDTPPLPSLPAPPSTTTLVAVLWDGQTHAVSLTMSLWVGGAITAILVFVILWRIWGAGYSFKNFEIDQAEIGVGQQKFKFKPNITDKQVAYAIWVELSTRKIGLPIDLDDDVISEIYDSWYAFFAVTRELIKDIPVQRVKKDSTQAIIRLSIEVLNEGLRPHLTKWQARFRQWYNLEVERYGKDFAATVLEPQMIQANFPKFAELRDDMQRVNTALIRYRNKMQELTLKD
jgi:hypothetical protein